MNEPTCDVLWWSHGCGLPARHKGDHACFEPGEEPHFTVPRDGRYGDMTITFYGTLFDWTDDWCELCGARFEWLTDHFRDMHPEYPDEIEWPAGYLGEGQWEDNERPSPSQD